ncbi:MAG: putative lumazine-binding, partial [Geminicoccaceae bacterium]|nr:putative lumazine-binding [Geminicoccaceae bacterium]
MNRLLLFAAVLIVNACASGPSASSASSPSPSRNDPAEEQAVLATVQRMFDAMRTRDTAAFREIFEPNARLVGMRTRQT